MHEETDEAPPGLPAASLAAAGAAPAELPESAWSQEAGDAGLWVTIAPGVQARAEVAATGHSDVTTSTHGDRGQRDLGADGGVHRASGDSMDAARPVAGMRPSRSPGVGRLSKDPQRERSPSEPPQTDHPERSVTGDQASGKAPRPRAARSTGAPVRRMIAVVVALTVVIVAVAVIRAVREVAASTAAASPVAAGGTAVGAAPGSVDESGPASSSSPAGSGSALAAGGETASAAVQPGTSPGAVPAEWWSVLDSLDERRARALASADLDAITTYAAAGSPFERSETALIDQLVGDRLRPHGWATKVVGVEAVAAREPTPAGEPTVTVTVVDERMAYQLIDEAGTPVRSVPTSGKRRWLVTLIGGSSDAPGSPQPTATGPDEGLADARSAVADDAAGALDGGVSGSPSGASGGAGTEPDGGAAGGADPGSQGSPGSAAGDVAGWRIASVEAIP